MNKIVFALLGMSPLLFCSLKAEESISSVPPTPLTPSVTQSSKASEEGIVLFTPPTGWHMADPSLLPIHVKAMVVGSGPSSFPPSMNLSWEPYQGTLRQYLKIVKNMNSAQGYEWKDLGTIQTEAGLANLSQVDTKTQWGDVRLMHVILVKNGSVYILTASALKNEFSIFYKDFFAALRSLKVACDAYEMVVNPQQRSQLKAAAHKIQKQWQTLLAQKQKENPTTHWAQLQEETFKSEDFQNKIWKPFLDMLNKNYTPLGTNWLSLFQQKFEDQLFKVKP